MHPGKLYIVSTPIGNLADITLRALEVLKTADYIVSEDIRETNKLLKHYEIEKKPQVTYKDQTRNRVIPEILQLLEQGNSVALVTDRGTPLISDPGFKLVTEVKTSGYEVIPVPGPSAVITALTVAGLPTDKYVFLGFLPKKSGQRANILKKYGELDATLVIYESPYRLVKLLQEVKEALGDRTVCVASELTKMHERANTGKISEISAILNVASSGVSTKGEHVVLIAKEGFNQHGSANS